jgi:hypothetical protein
MGGVSCHDVLMDAAGVDGVVMVVPAGLGGPGGSLRVDPERAQACIDGLRAVALDLLDAQRVTKAMVFPAPANDAVSLNLAVQGAKMAAQAEAYVVAWRQQISQTADALEQQLAAYRAAEALNRERLA